MTMASSHSEIFLNRDSGTKDPTFENVEIPEELGPIAVVVDDALIKQYAFCMDDYHPWHFDSSPLGTRIAHASLVAQDLLTVYCSKYDRTNGASIHTEEELQFHAPIPIGETVTVTGKYTEKFVRRGTGQVVMEAEARDSNGRLLVSHRGIEIMKIRFGEVMGRGTAKEISAKVDPTSLDVPPAQRAVPGIRPGTPLVGKTKSLSQAQMSVYSFAGEYEKNFHNDLDIARRDGMDRTMAQGQQTVGYLSEMCTEFFGLEWFTSGWMRAKFLLPVWPNSTLTVEGKVVGEETLDSGQTKVSLEVWVKDQDERLVTVGWASGVTEATTPS